MNSDTLLQQCKTMIFKTPDRTDDLRKLTGSLRKHLAASDLVYAMGFEALGKNPVFLDRRVERSRGMDGETKSREAVHKALKGSSLWKNDNTGLSGAISLKSGCAVHGATGDSLTWLEEWTADYEKAPGSLFVITGVTLALEGIKLSLAHLAKMITNRLLRLTNPAFSGLPAFMLQNPAVFRRIQLKAAKIDTQISHLSTPCSLYRPALMNEAEDLSQSFGCVLSTAKQIAEQLAILFAMEALCGVMVFQARGTKPDGAGTAVLYEMIRKRFPDRRWEDLFDDCSLQSTAGLLEKCAGGLAFGGEYHQYTET